MTSILIILTIIAAHNGFSQGLSDDSLNIMLENAKDQYDDGDYISALSVLQNNLYYFQGKTLFEAHKYLAFCYASINENNDAADHFRIVFRMNPRWKLDPLDSSPAIDRILIATKKDMAKEAGMCSCFIPGIGQMMKGENNKSVLILSSSGATLFLSLVSWLITSDKHKSYLSVGPGDPAALNKAYHSYNSWFRTATISSAAFLGVYAYGVIDAFLFQTSYKSAQVMHHSGILYVCECAGWRLGYEIDF